MCVCVCVCVCVYIYIRSVDPNRCLRSKGAHRLAKLSPPDPIYIYTCIYICMCVCVYIHIWVDPSYVAKAQTPCLSSPPWPLRRRVP